MLRPIIPPDYSEQIEETQGRIECLEKHLQDFEEYSITGDIVDSTQEELDSQKVILKGFELFQAEHESALQRAEWIEFREAVL